MRHIPAIGTALISLLLLSACNTIEGVGRDIESAGDAIGDAAEDNK
ncbi:entericidin A/B family lipoprotein [Parasphingorhabdus sp. DH2-15]|jgi:predicted small secreted protein